MNNHYCYNSPWCESGEVCRCEKWDKHEQEQESIKKRLDDIKNYLNKPWNGIGDNFVNRLLAKIEYNKLIKKYDY